MFKRKCKITFIAHGATIYSEENRISDAEKYPPINESGQEEIKKICQFLKKRGVKNDKIYCSPNLRSFQSARMIAETFKQEVQVIESLYTKKCGVWNNLTFDDLEEKFPQALEEYHKNPCRFIPEGGESLLDFNSRIDECIKNVVEENIGGRIIIVTNPDIIQSAIHSALNIPPENQTKIRIKTGSATQISYYDGWASLVYSGYIPL